MHNLKKYLWNCKRTFQKCNKKLHWKGNGTKTKWMKKVLLAIILAHVIRFCHSFRRDI